MKGLTSDLNRLSSWVLVWLAIGIVVLVMGLPVLAAEEKTAEVESRGTLPMQQQKQLGRGQTGKFPLPTWPQKWDVNNREPAGFGFGVTQPGPVIVEVHSQGVPIAVELYGAAVTAVQRQTGTGTIRLNYQVTPADIQRSALWHVRILLAQAGGPPAQASGTISVQYPAVDHNVVLAQIQSRRAQRPVPNQESVARARKELDAAFQASKAQFEQEKAARRAALEAKAQSQLNAALAQSKAGIQSRAIDVGGAIPEEAPVPTEGDVSSRALAPTKPLIMQQAPLVLHPASPAIYSLSATEGGPIDPIIINGTGFVDQSHVEVHFVLAPGMDLATREIKYCGDPTCGNTIVYTYLPNYKGVAAPVNGSIYVVRLSDGQRSSSVPFTFKAAPSPPTTPPTISSLSVTEGEPIDPIIIKGTGFSGQAMEVHYVLGPGMDLVGTNIQYCGDPNCGYTTIMIRLPNYEGIAAPVSGSIYVVRKDDGQRSPSVPFTFKPEIVLDTYFYPGNKLPPAPIDSLVTNPDADFNTPNAPPGWVWYGDAYGWLVSVASSGLFGYKGNDQFFNTKVLKNNWHVAFVGAGVIDDCHCNNPTHDVYVADARIGTASPYVNVRVWEYPFIEWFFYSFSVQIKGPKGVPFE